MARSQPIVYTLTHSLSHYFIHPSPNLTYSSFILPLTHFFTTFSLLCPDYKHAPLLPSIADNSCQTEAAHMVQQGQICMTVCVYIHVYIYIGQNSIIVK